MFGSNIFRCIIRTTCLWLLAVTAVWAQPMATLIYTSDSASDSALNSYRILDSINDHYQQMTVLAPQVFHLEKNGLVWGSVDQRIEKRAEATQISLMPLVVNEGFSRTQIHHFLHDQKAQERAIGHLLAICQRYHLDGIQIDFENIDIDDRPALTRFYQQLAEAFHDHDLRISIALVPPRHGMINRYQAYVKTFWAGWADYEKLARASDFIVVMTYDRHTVLTTPGPVTNARWVEQVVQNLVDNGIDNDKIMLGIPGYSGYWQTRYLGSPDITGSHRISARASQISYEQAQALLDKHNKALNWDEQDATGYAIFKDHFTYSYLFMDDVRTFKALYKIAQRYDLKGVALWKLGLEDPRIWDFLEREPVLKSGI